MVVCTCTYINCLILSTFCIQHTGMQHSTCSRKIVFHSVTKMSIIFHQYKSHLSRPILLLQRMHDHIKINIRIYRSQKIAFDTKSFFYCLISQYMQLKFAYIDFLNQLLAKIETYDYSTDYMCCLSLMYVSLRLLYFSPISLTCTTNSCLVISFKPIMIW